MLDRRCLLPTDLMDRFAVVGVNLDPGTPDGNHGLTCQELRGARAAPREIAVLHVGHVVVLCGGITQVRPIERATHRNRGSPAHGVVAKKKRRRKCPRQHLRFGFFLHVISAMLAACVAVLLTSLALVLAQTDINLETLGQSVPLSFKTFDKNVLTVPLPWIIAYTSSPSEALEAAAREHEGLIRFGTVDPEAEVTLLKFQGLEESNIPKFRVYPVGMAEEKEHFTVASVCLH